MEQTEIDAKIQDIKEILELSEEEINNDADINATLDLTDLKSLKFLYEQYIDEHEELMRLKDCYNNIHNKLLENINDAKDVIKEGNYLDNFNGTNENQRYYYDGFYDASLLIHQELYTYDSSVIDEIN